MGAFINPLLAEIDAAHANLSPGAQKAIALSGVAPSPAAGAPEAVAANGAAAAPAAGAPAPIAPRPIAGPTPMRGLGPAPAQPDPAQTQRVGELNRLTSGDTAKSGINQIHSPWARIPLQVADAIGTGFFPRLAMGIPGTQLHHNMLVHMQNNAVNEGEKLQTGEVEREHLGAETAGLPAKAELEQAQADALKHPKPKYGNPIATPEGYVVPNETTSEATPLTVGGKQAQPVEKTQKQDIHALYAEAVADALHRGVNPTDDPKVKQLAGSITELQRQPAPKEPARDDKAISIYSKPMAQRTPEENSYLKGYEQYINTSKTQPGVARMEVLANTKEYGIIDPNTHEVRYATPREINAMGNAAPAGAGATAMGKQAIFQDLHYNIDTARQAIQNLDSLDTGTRAALAYALRHTDPKSAFQSFLTGSVGQAMTPQQQEAVQSLALLAENAMTLRGVSGMGQGSDELRSAILNTIPSAKSPSKGYALGQLDKFEAVVKRLEGGVPKVGNQQAVQQGGGQSGTVRFSDGGKTYSIPADQSQEFLKDHPTATKATNGR